MRLSKSAEGLILFFLPLLFALVWAYQARVLDDAYITFRVVENLVQGDGLRWNIQERVQAFTNPLWALLHIPFYYLVRDIYAVTLALSFVCFAAAIYVACKTFYKNTPHVLLFFLFPLLTSASFFVYSSSGLETPLTHLLFAWFGYLLVKKKAESHWWFWLSFITALSITNRLDLSIFYLPVWIYLFAAHRRAIRWRQLFAGSVPLVAWLGFSLIYYGFIFPNTRYAKLSTGFDFMQYVQSGLYSVAHLGLTDWPSLLWVMLALTVLPFILLYRRHVIPGYGALISISVGIAAYVAYTIFVGGGFQFSAKFFSLPIFASLWLFYAVMQSPPLPSYKLKVMIGAVLLAAITSQLSYPSVFTLSKLSPDAFSARFPNPRHVTKQPSYNAPCARGAVMLRDVLQGMQIPPKARSHPPAGIINAGAIGQLGYCASEQTIIMDRYALADPLLARLPSSQKRLHIIGHSRRATPKGYRHAIKTGDASKMDATLAVYYNALRVITAGDLFTGTRIKTIIRFNLGYYDRYRDAYLKSLPRNRGR